MTDADVLKPGDEFIPYKLFVGAFIPNALMRYGGLSSSAKLVWSRLAQFAGRDGRCFPSQEQIAEEIGSGRRTVQRALTELQGQGFIRSKHPEGRGRLAHLPCEYVFLWHPVFCASGGVKMARPGASKRRVLNNDSSRESFQENQKQQGAREIENLKPKELESEETQPPDPCVLVDHSWQQFRQIMPLRAGKFLDEEACRSKWAREPAKWAQWLAAVKNYAGSAEVSAGAVCSPMKFLSRKWQDWLTPEASSGPGPPGSQPDYSWMKNLQEDERIIEQERQAGTKERTRPPWAQQTTPTT
jgi:biotin operon repressor